MIFFIVSWQSMMTVMIASHRNVHIASRVCFHDENTDTSKDDHSCSTVKASNRSRAIGFATAMVGGVVPSAKQESHVAVWVPA
jgi:hypothetical protein